MNTTTSQLVWQSHEEYQNSEAGEPIRTDEAKIMTHPIFTNKEDEGVDGGVTHSKNFWQTRTNISVLRTFA